MASLPSETSPVPTSWPQSDFPVPHGALVPTVLSQPVLLSVFHTSMIYSAQSMPLVTACLCPGHYHWSLLLSATIECHDACHSISSHVFCCLSTITWSPCLPVTRDTVTATGHYCSSTSECSKQEDKPLAPGILCSSEETRPTDTGSAAQVQGGSSSPSRTPLCLPCSGQLPPLPPTTHTHTHTRLATLVPFERARCFL